MLAALRKLDQQKAAVRNFMKNIMFLCTGNSCRSQMAEGFCRKYWGDKFNVYSAGTKKHGMNERAMKVMKEAGVDISSHFSKTTGNFQKLLSTL